MRTGFSLKSLEIFETIARCHSVTITARELGCSISTVSQHLHRLEEQLGVELIDHSTRPLSVTPIGQAFLKRASIALRELRLAENETLMADKIQARSLSLGIIDDVESDLAPELAVALASGTPGLRLVMTSHPSHEALQKLVSRQLDVAFAMRPEHAHPELQEYPLLRDPFVLVTSLVGTDSAEDLLFGRTNLPFLRYNPKHIIGQQIEAHLKRNRISLENRFEIDSIQSSLALVAGGHGWTISTALGYLRARRFHPSLRLMQIPGPAFARYVSLFARQDQPTTLIQTIYNISHRLFATQALPQLTERFPWLSDQMRPPDFKHLDKTPEKPFIPRM